jgi:hypothetical protein
VTVPVGVPVVLLTVTATLNPWETVMDVGVGVTVTVAVSVLVAGAVQPFTILATLREPRPVAGSKPAVAL